MLIVYKDWWALKEVRKAKTERLPKSTSPDRS